MPGAGTRVASRGRTALDPHTIAPGESEALRDDLPADFSELRRPRPELEFRESLARRWEFDLEDTPPLSSPDRADLDDAEDTEGESE